MRTESTTFRRAVLMLLMVAGLPAMHGCDQLGTILGEFRIANAPKEAIITLIAPSEDGTIMSGATVRVEWADTAYVVPTTVKAEALRLDATGAVTETIVLAETRDAFADGQSDVIEFDTTGRGAGRFQFRVTLSAPDKDPRIETSTAIITVP